MPRLLFIVTVLPGLSICKIPPPPIVMLSGSGEPIIPPICASLVMLIVPPLMINAGPRTKLLVPRKLSTLLPDLIRAKLPLISPLNVKLFVPPNVESAVITIGLGRLIPLVLVVTVPPFMVRILVDVPSAALLPILKVPAESIESAVNVFALVMVSVPLPAFVNPLKLLMTPLIVLLVLSELIVRVNPPPSTGPEIFILPAPVVVMLLLPSKFNVVPDVAANPLPLVIVKLFPAMLKRISAPLNDPFAVLNEVIFSGNDVPLLPAVKVLFVNTMPNDPVKLAPPAGASVIALDVVAAPLK